MSEEEVKRFVLALLEEDGKEAAAGIRDRQQVQQEEVCEASFSISGMALKQLQLTHEALDGLARMAESQVALKGSMVATLIDQLTMKIDRALREVG